jgi:hypothetical protein
MSEIVDNNVRFGRLNRPRVKAVFSHKTMRLLDIRI